VIFSAHGVPKSVPAEARARKMIYPRRHLPARLQGAPRGRAPFTRGREIMLIGHAGHPGGDRHDGPAAAKAPSPWSRRRRAEFPPAAIPGALPTSPRRHCPSTTPPRSSPYLQRRFPGIARPHKEDICYATTNRQEAVKAIAERSDAVLVIGAPNSSNSRAPARSRRARGRARAVMVQRAAEIDWALAAARTVGITAGASAPEVLVEE
jgi:4-hydroxy-3-methylbut-2-enyl diphosphate reductase